MTTRLITGPEIEPISLAEAQAQVSVAEGDSTFDSTLLGLIPAAREAVEAYVDRGLLTQTIQLTMDKYPASILELPWAGPLQSITSVQYRLRNGNWVTVDPANYSADTDSEPGRLVLMPDYTWPSVELFPSVCFKVTYVVGHESPEQVPTYYKQAVKIQLAHMFMDREGTEDAPEAIGRLLNRHRLFTAIPLIKGV